MHIPMNMKTVTVTTAATVPAIIPPETPVSLFEVAEAEIVALLEIDEAEGVALLVGVCIAQISNE